MSLDVYSYRFVTGVWDPKELEGKEFWHCARPGWEWVPGGFGPYRVHHMELAEMDKHAADLEAAAAGFEAAALAATKRDAIQLMWGCARDARARTRNKALGRTALIRVREPR